MSLFGAMISGISGLNAQSQNLGTISDNISNLNTIGYKGTRSQFSTLVTTSGSVSTYSPGGVRAAPFALVDRQGLLQSTESPTDLAINGNGFLVVNEASSPTTGDDYLYTRAGSFTADKNGNLVNTAGYYLQGWKTDNNGVPLTSNLTVLNGLATVNVRGLGGSATATSNVTVAANLPATATTAQTHQVTVQIFDALGVAHNIAFSFAKTATLNQWTLTAANPTLGSTGATSGSVTFAASTIVFNGNGSLASTGGTTVTVAGWTSGSSNSTITLNLGTVGQTNGLTQFSDKFILSTTNQNGVPFGFFQGVAVDEEGILSARFDNGTSQKIYKVPIATFPNPNGLGSRNGNAYAESDKSGSFILQAAGGGGAGGGGKISASSLEASTIDLATEFANMIVTQRAYGANARTITTADQMLEELMRIGR